MLNLHRDIKTYGENPGEMGKSLVTTGRIIMAKLQSVGLIA